MSLAHEYNVKKPRSVANTGQAAAEAGWPA